MDPDLFFPERTEGESNRGNDAKAVCAHCPVSRPCLLTAIAHTERHGVWGGAGEPTRRRLSRLTDNVTFVTEHPDGCTCVFCIAVTAHLEAVAAAFTPRGFVVHGRWEAYVHAGCRCTPCTDAYLASGRTPRTPPPA